MPIVARLQRRLVDALLSNQSFLHTIDAGPAKGARMSIDLPADKAIWTGTYESKVAAELAAWVNPGDICFDVGGYRGFFSAVLALNGAGLVHVFEPLPANGARIEQLIGLNPNLPLKLHKIAIGAQVGEADLTVMPDASMGKLISSNFQPHAQSGQNLKVKVETLDNLVKSGAVPPPALIKIDVEGAEAMVLEGAKNLLKQSRPKLFIEVHSRRLADWCYRYVSDYKYQVVTIETGRAPDGQSEPEVCHFRAVAQAPG